MSIRDEIHPHAILDRKGIATLFLAAIEHQLDAIIENAVLPVLLKSMRVNHALGPDIDLLAKIFGLVRFHQEDDEDFRGRISSYVPTLEKTTHQGIKNLFYYLSGQDPIIEEQFETFVYRPGDPVPADEHLAKFYCQMPYKMGIVREVVRVIDAGEGSGNTVQTNRTNYATPHNCDAWLHEDIDHDTSIFSSLDTETGIVTLSSSYTANTKVDLYYEVVPEGTWDVSLQSTYQYLLNLWKAVGVQAIFQTVQLETEINFTADQEVLGITEVFFITGVGHSEQIPPFVEEQRDATGHWDVGLWDNPESLWDDARNPKIWFKEKTDTS